MGFPLSFFIIIELNNSFLQAKTQTLKMTIVSGLRIIDSNAQTGITWWNWTTITSSIESPGLPSD